MCTLACHRLANFIVLSFRCECRLLFLFMECGVMWGKMMEPPLDLTPYTLLLGDQRVVRKIKRHDFITFGLNPTQKAVCGS